MPTRASSRNVVVATRPIRAWHQPVATTTVTLSSPFVVLVPPGFAAVQKAVGEPEEEPGGGVGNADPAVPPVADGEGLTDFRCDLRGRGAVADVQPRRGRLGRRAVGEEYADEEHPVAAVDDARDAAERPDVGRPEATLVAGGANESAAVIPDRVDAPGDAPEGEHAAGGRGQPPLRRQDTGPAATGVGRDVVPGTEDVGACRHGGRPRRRAEVEGVGRRRTGRRRSTTRDDSAERDHDHEGRVGAPSNGHGFSFSHLGRRSRPDARQRSDRMDEEAMRTA